VNLPRFIKAKLNETNARKAGMFTTEDKGKLVTRGASLCLYVARAASQGRDLYLNVEKFLERPGEGTKAYHHRQPRVALQESSPQNNFRRIIAALVPVGEFFNHTVNYCPAHECTVDLRLIVAVLNSKLADWYFRLGSTNAHVSHYQLYNLPFPAFTNSGDAKLIKSALAPLLAGQPSKAFEIVKAELLAGTFSLAAVSILTGAVDRIIALETERGVMSRTDRSALDPAAQPYQDLIDGVLFATAGLTPQESAALEARLKTML